jgi:hypothetical protein
MAPPLRYNQGREKPAPITIPTAKLPFPQQIPTAAEKIFTNCYQNQKTSVYLSADKAIKQ